MNIIEKEGLDFNLSMARGCIERYKNGEIGPNQGTILPYNPYLENLPEAERSLDTSKRILKEAIIGQHMLNHLGIEKICPFILIAFRKQGDKRQWSKRRKLQFQKV